MSETQISAHTFGFEWPTSWGASGRVDFKVSKDFTSVDGRRYLAGMLRSADVTVVSRAATLAGVSLPKTTNTADGESVKITGQVFDARGNKVKEFFSGRINHELLDATNWPAIFSDNAGRRRPFGDTFLNTSSVIALLQTVVHALGSAVEYGRLRLSKAPDDSADPVAVGKNDYAGAANAGIGYADTEPDGVPTFVTAGSIRLPVARGRVTLVGGVAEVETNAVAAASDIFLTGQDDYVSGALRVPARTEDEGFTIASTNGADSGVVSWVLYND